MFLRKNIIVIALIAIFLMGAFALSAVTFQVRVHVTGSGNGWYKSTNTSKVYLDWEDGTHPMTITDDLGAEFECWGTGGLLGGTDYDEGVLDPYNINHFYLDLTPPEEDDTIPGNQ